MSKQIATGVILKRLGITILSLMAVMLAAASSHAALVDGGDLKVRFDIDADNSGFSFEGLTLNLHAGLGAKDGIK